MSYPQSIGHGVDVSTLADMPFSCDLCYEQRASRRRVEFSDGCRLNACVQCALGYMEVEVKANRLPLRCPQRCCADVDVWQCADVTEAQKKHPYAVERLLNAVIERTLMDNPKRCSNPRCREVIDVGKPCGDTFACPRCNEETCLTCGEVAHEGRRCNEVNAERLLTAHLAQLRGWQQCPNCHVPVERTAGCNLIGCLCGTQFCYGCGARRGAGHPRCACPPARVDYSSFSLPPDNNCAATVCVDANSRPAWRSFFDWCTWLTGRPAVEERSVVDGPCEIDWRSEF